MKKRSTRTRDDQGLYEEREVVRLCNLSRLTLYRARKRQQLGFYQAGSKILYSRDHIEAYLKTLEHPARTRQN